jgi:16S rRNA (uracil1498-N3)-methyltransferase
MPARRFFVEEMALREGAELVLPDAVAHQARDVLRLARGETLYLLDGVGGEYHAELITVERRQVTVRVGARMEGWTDPAVRVVLCQGMLKAAKFEWVLQKCTELGVAAFVPLHCERAVAAAEVATTAKWQRWGRIIAEAMEQCGGTRLPEIAKPRPLLQALADLPAGALALIPWEGERTTTLRAALMAAWIANANLQEVRLFIGPEGGFASEEVLLAQRQGATPVTLGARILRAETAAVVAVALTLETLGTLGTQHPSATA